MFFIFILLFPIFFLLGYLVHRFFHNPLAGSFYKSHLNHHFIQYPTENFTSDVYRDPGKDNSVHLFAIAFSPIIVGLVLLVLFGYVNLFWGLIFSAQMAFIGWLNDSLHDGFHLNNTIWKKFWFFEKLKYLHYIHHVDVKTNYGIFFFGFDRLFRTFKK